ncbi:MAG: hypothetical protein IJ240_11355 [Clostridia bacterium]|nr:hypothetical protein [Clostridia bacterium]
MANNISLFKATVPMLDEVYKQATLTGLLDGAPVLAQAGANADEMIVPMLDMSGLADYDRASGYRAGDVTLTNQTVRCNFDRGRLFTVDSMDDAETAGIAFGRLSGEFIRTRVVPELDAFRIAAYAGHTGATLLTGSLSTGEAVVEALRACVNALDESEVPFEDRVLFILPTLRGLIEDLDTVKSRAVLGRFSEVISVPRTRMYTKITQTDNGYHKADGALDLNFLCVHKDAVIQFQKHIAPKVVPPELNQDADAWKFGYRSVGIAAVYQNKAAGIYAHAAPGGGA